MPNALRTPSYRLHKPSGRAVVMLDGKDFYLGKHGSKASRIEYDRLIGEWTRPRIRFLLNNQIDQG